jgi:uncharacterized protein with NRDE domain
VVALGVVREEALVPPNATNVARLDTLRENVHKVVKEEEEVVVEEVEEDSEVGVVEYLELAEGTLDQEGLEEANLVVDIKVEDIDVYLTYITY